MCRAGGAVGEVTWHSAASRLLPRGLGAPVHHPKGAPETQTCVGMSTKEIGWSCEDLVGQEKGFRVSSGSSLVDQLEVLQTSSWP